VTREKLPVEALIVFATTLELFIFIGLNVTTFRLLIEALTADKFSTLIELTDTVVVVYVKLFGGAFPYIDVVKLIYYIVRRFLIY